MKKYQVYLGTCDKYHPQKIENVIKDGIQAILPTKSISGKIVIKPNLVMAHPAIATEGYTRAEVIEGILANLNSHQDSISIVEKSGLNVSTRSMYQWAKYTKLKKKYPIKLIATEESRQVRIQLKKSKLHSDIKVAKALMERDFLIFTPKLKTNVLSHGLSAALKLNIGIVDSTERLIHHHQDLPVKIVDLLEPANPDLIVTDAIRFSYGGNQMTQHGTDLGLLIIADNAVAHDMVCAHLLNLNPHKIEHLQEAIDRGYGPKSMDEIEIIGDYNPEKARDITATLDYGFMPVEDFPSNFQIKSGTPYCTGGCQGIFLDWLHMIKDRSPRELKKFPKIPVLIGEVTEAIKSNRILLVGKCAARSKNVNARWKYRIPGCPPTHKEIVLFMMIYFFLLAPLVRISLIWDCFVLYPIKKIKGWCINFKLIISSQCSQQLHPESVKD